MEAILVTVSPLGVDRHGEIWRQIRTAAKIATDNFRKKCNDFSCHLSYGHVKRAMLLVLQATHNMFCISGVLVQIESFSSRIRPSYTTVHKIFYCKLISKMWQKPSFMWISWGTSNPTKVTLNIPVLYVCCAENKQSYFAISALNIFKTNCEKNKNNLKTVTCEALATHVFTKKLQGIQLFISLKAYDLKRDHMFTTCRYYQK